MRWSANLRGVALATVEVGTSEVGTKTVEVPSEGYRCPSYEHFYMKHNRLPYHRRTCIKGTFFIEREDECSAAAVQLGLADTVPSLVSPTRSRPHGCYYEDLRLFFNPVGNKESTDNSRISICRYAMNWSVSIDGTKITVRSTDPDQGWDVNLHLNCASF